MHGTPRPESSFSADVDASTPGRGLPPERLLRDGERVYRTWYTNGRGVEH